MPKKTLLVLPLSALLLAGCGPIDAGTAGAEDFRQWMEGTSGVTEVKAGGVNTLPFTGEVSAEVFTEELNASDLNRVAEKAVSFETSQHFNVSLHLTHDEEPAEIYLSVQDPSVNSENIDFALKALSTDATSISLNGDVNSRMNVQASTNSNPWVTMEQLTALNDSAKVRWELTSPEWFIQAEGPWDAQRGRQAVEAISAKYPVVSGEVKYSRLTVRLGMEESPEVTEDIRKLLPNQDLTLQYSNVTVSDSKGENQTSASPTLQPLLEILKTRTEDISINASGTHLDISVRSAADIFTLDEALRTAPQYQEATLLYRTSDGRFNVYTAYHDIQEVRGDLEAMSVISSVSDVREVTVTSKEWRIELSRDLKPERAETLGRELKGTIPEGVKVDLGAGLSRWLVFTAEDKLNVDQETVKGLDSQDLRFFKAFKAGWEN